jgi:hypothetical protein
VPGGVSYLGDFLPPPPPPEPSGLVGAAARVSARDTGLDRVRPCETVGRGGEAGETWEFLRAGGGGPGLVKLSAEPCLVVPFVGGGGGRDCEGTLGGGRGAARSTTELMLFLLGRGGGNPTGPVDVCSGLGGGEGGHWEGERSPEDFSGLLLGPRNRLACASSSAS